MPEALLRVAVVTALVLVVAGVVGWWWPDGRNRSGCRVVAGELGWSFAPARADWGFGGLSLLGLEHPLIGHPFDEDRPSVVNRATGPYQGYPATVMTVRHLVSRDEGVATVRVAVAVLDLGLVRPGLQVSRTGVGAARLGWEQVRLPDFRFAVHTDDPAFAAAVLGPVNRRWWSDDERLAPVGIRLEGTALVAWRPGALRGEGVRPLLDLLVDVAHRLPREA